MIRVVILLGLANSLVVHSLGSYVDDQAETDASVEIDVRRRQMQEYNREAFVQLRDLLSAHLSQTPATLEPYPPRAAGRRRKLASTARPTYSSKCLYKHLKAVEVNTSPSGPFPPPSSPPPPPPPPSLPSPTSPTSPSEIEMITASLTGSLRDSPLVFPSTSAGRCYLNPMVVAQNNFTEPESPIEIMLLKAAWTAYQCSFEKRKGRCGTYRHPPYDCRWLPLEDPEDPEKGQCAVTSDYLLPRLLAYLHCRDDAIMSPFWDRCYTVGVTLLNDSDWCGQSDGNWARCWWFDEGVCGPSPGGGVESRDIYDDVVGSISKGFWDRNWFGSCATAELMYTIKSRCNYTDDGDCNNDPHCTLWNKTDLQYGRCRLRDDVIWNAFKESGSLLFAEVMEVMEECAAASSSYEECMNVGEVEVDPEKFSDVIDLVFIEEVTPDSDSSASPLSAPSVPLLVATVTAATLVGRWLLGAMTSPFSPVGAAL